MPRPMRAVVVHVRLEGIKGHALPAYRSPALSHPHASQACAFSI